MRQTADSGIDAPVRIDHGSHHSPSHDEEWASIRKNLLRALPRIDPKYFYDDAGSHLFEEITRLPEYYQTRTEEALLATIADEVVGITGAQELIELGSGAGRKIRLLLDSMHRSEHLEGCVLLDINETFLRASARTLAGCYPGMEVRGVVGDFLHDLGSVGHCGRRRLFIFLAGTIGNLYPRQMDGFLRRVRAALGPSDAFLVGVDLVKDPERLEAAYNDSVGVTAEFNLNTLRVLNRRFGTDFEIDAFAHVAFYDADQEWIEMRLRARRPTSVSLDSTRRLHFATGDDIRTEISRKFTRASFTASLDGTGLELSKWFTDADELFASALVRPTGDRTST